MKLDTVPNAAKQRAGADSCPREPGSLTEGAPQPSRGAGASGVSQSSFFHTVEITDQWCPGLLSGCYVGRGKLHAAPRGTLT